MNGLEKRVRTGAQWMDHEKPGWEEDIDREKLDIQNCDNCVLGQALGGYVSRSLPCFSIEFAVDHGFTANSLPQEWLPLKTAWLSEINARLTAKKMMTRALERGNLVAV